MQFFMQLIHSMLVMRCKYLSLCLFCKKVLNDVGAEYSTRGIFKKKKKKKICPAIICQGGRLIMSQMRIAALIFLTPTQ
jgi:hypothetical protein